MKFRSKCAFISISFFSLKLLTTLGSKLHKYHLRSTFSYPFVEPFILFLVLDFSESQYDELFLFF